MSKSAKESGSYKDFKFSLKKESGKEEEEKKFSSSSNSSSSGSSSESKKYKKVMLIGDELGDQNTEPLNRFKSGETLFVARNTEKNPLTLKSLHKSLYGMIDSETDIEVISHGLEEDGSLSLQLFKEDEEEEKKEGQEEDELETNSAAKLFSELGKCSLGKPLRVRIRSCDSNAASDKDILHLPDRSFCMTFVDSDKGSLMKINIEGPLLSEDPFWGKVAPTQHPVFDEFIRRLSQI